MREQGPQRLRVLLGIVSRSDRMAILSAALAQTFERWGVVAATAWVASAGTRYGAWVAVGLGSLFLVRSLLASTLRTRVRARAIEVLAHALLADSTDLTTPAGEDWQPALLEGLHATDEALADALPRVVGDGLACVGLAVFVFWREPPRLILVGGTAIAVGAAVVAGVRRLTTSSAERVWNALVPALDDLTTAIHGRLELVGNGQAQKFERAVVEKVSAWRAEVTGARGISFLAGRAPVIGAAAIIGLFLLHYPSSDALVHAAILASVTPAFAGVAKSALDLPRTMVAARPLLECVGRASELLTDGTRNPSVSETVTCEGISFAYPGDARLTLSTVSMRWQLGSLFMLAGQNGSGKSTLLRLLLGLHTPLQGEIHVGDVPLRDVRRQALRNQVGFLVQRPFLPGALSVEEAIRLVASDATPTAIESLLVRLGLWSILLRRSPNAPLAVRIGSLSAGERQRVAIARVLLRDAWLLLLDEPDANLDADGIILLGPLLREEAAKRLVIVIAHNPTLLAFGHRVVHLENGRVRAT